LEWDGAINPSIENGGIAKGCVEEELHHLDCEEE
jgi:hypothetical protein